MYVYGHTVWLRSEPARVGYGGRQKRGEADPRREGKGVLCAVSLHRAGKYNILF